MSKVVTKQLMRTFVKDLWSNEATISTNFELWDVSDKVPGNTKYIVISARANSGDIHITQFEELTKWYIFKGSDFDELFIAEVSGGNIRFKTTVHPTVFYIRCFAIIQEYLK